jgi:hypothetical protein
MKSSLKLAILLIFSFTLFNEISAQELTQTIRGAVLDQDTRQGIIGASVVILGSDPLQGTTTNVNGAFSVEGVGVGRVNLAVSYLGYQERVIPNILVTTAKEVVLEIQLVESVQQLKEVVVLYRQKKTETRDEMALASARAFTVEETSRYAGAINDPARMVSAFPGITGNAAGGNEIVVRGNSPKGVLWRLEGVEIPNPNHFSDEGSTGGPINALNSTMLANSDFFTGAFAPSYGNAYSGVFDIYLRNGNNQKREYTFQANTVGLDFTLEGPFKKGYEGSYLLNYRYSSLDLLDNLGLVDYGGVPKYQDLSFKVNLPTNTAGRFSLFGLAGNSSILSELEDEDIAGLIVERTDVKANMGVIGLNHTLLLGDRTYLKSYVALSKNGSQLEGERRAGDDTFYESLDSKLDKYATRFSMNLHHKMNARNKLQTGFIFTRYQYDFNHQSFDYDAQALETLLSAKDHTGLWQGYGSWKHRINDQVQLVGGLHVQYFTFNDSYSIEPRLSFDWQVHPKHRLFAGFGIHSRLSAIPEYLAQDGGENGERTYFNQDLELPKARHYVLGHDFQFNAHTHLKTELYYQDLYDVPVGAEPGSTFSILNDIGSFSTEPLINQGRGYNYGVEFTLERFLEKNFYYLLTASIYNSKYQAADEVWRDTRFNGNYATNLLVGKEYVLKSKNNKEKTLGFNTRLLRYGGLRYTPIDLEASRVAGKEVRLDALPFSEKGDDVMRLDVSIVYRINRPKTTQTLKLEIQNASNHDALVDQYYNNYGGK